jgi:hypothetical protein
LTSLPARFDDNAAGQEGIFYLVAVGARQSLAQRLHQQLRIVGNNSIHA